MLVNLTYKLTYKFETNGKRVANVTIRLQDRFPIWCHVEKVIGKALISE